MDAVDGNHSARAQGPEAAPLQHEELTEAVIGCAYRVHNSMGFGFLESVYQKCLLIELRRAGIGVETRVPIEVRYAGEVAGDFVADMVVADSVIVELKSVRRIALAHEVQLVNYLVATGKDVGLILNFGETKVEVRRKVRTLSRSNPTRGTRPDEQDRRDECRSRS